MTSALEIATTALLAATDVTDLVDSRITPGAAPQGQGLPYIVVGLVSDRDDQMVAGAAGYRSSRVSVACVAGSATAANLIGETVVTALGNITKASVAGASDVDVMKEGTDFLDHDDSRTVFRRQCDFTIRWRQ